MPSPRAVRDEVEHRGELAEDEHAMAAVNGLAEQLAEKTILAEAASSPLAGDRAAADRSRPGAASKAVSTRIGRRRRLVRLSIPVDLALHASLGRPLARAQLS